jgi:hypothetical protein
LAYFDSINAVQPHTFAAHIKGVAINHTDNT